MGLQSICHRQWRRPPESAAYGYPRLSTFREPLCWFSRGGLCYSRGKKRFSPVSDLLFLGTNNLDLVWDQYSSNSPRNFVPLYFVLREHEHFPRNVQVEKMNLHRALGVPGASSAGTRDFMVIQLVGAVLRTGKQSVPAPPPCYRSPACFALLRWDGMVVGRTPSCTDVCEPAWREQVSLEDQS